MNEKQIQQLLDSIPAIAATGDGEAVKKALDLIDALRQATPVTTQQAAPGKYLYARVLTMEDGTRHYHPLIGGYMPSSNQEDYKMDAYDSILELQDSYAATTASMASRMGYNMQILYVPNDVYDALAAKLAELVTSVFTAIDEAAVHLEQAAQIMGNPMAEGAMKAMALQQVMMRPAVSGVGLTATNEIVDKADYVDQELPEQNAGDYSETSYYAEEDEYNEYGDEEGDEE